MIKIALGALAVLLVGQAAAAPPSPLVGVWIEVNVPGMARIAPYAETLDLLCATGLERRPGQGVVETGLVLTGVRADEVNRRRGTYHDNGRKLPATLQMADASQVEMKVCLFVICQKASYTRRGDTRQVPGRPGSACRSLIDAALPKGAVSGFK